MNFMRIKLLLNSLVDIYVRMYTPINNIYSHIYFHNNKYKKISEIVLKTLDVFES